MSDNISKVASHVGSVDEVPAASKATIKEIDNTAQAADVTKPRANAIGRIKLRVAKHAHALWTMTDAAAVALYTISGGIAEVTCGSRRETGAHSRSTGSSA